MVPLSMFHHTAVRVCFVEGFSSSPSFLSRHYTDLRYAQRQVRTPSSSSIAFSTAFFVSKKSKITCPRHGAGAFRLYSSTRDEQQESSVTQRINNATESTDHSAASKATSAATHEQQQSSFTGVTMNATRGNDDDGASILAINPADVMIVEEPPVVTQVTAVTDTEYLRSLPFVNMFRGSANYIANHRNTLAVYHIPGGLLSDERTFRDLMNDVALTWLLGMRLVIVVGCRRQIETRLGISFTQQPHGLRVTDETTLRIVKEEAGYVRFEVERQLARALRMQGGGSDTASIKGYYDGNVVSGNFYSAQPFGILDGIDYKFTGFVRRVEVEKIQQLHDSRDICLLTTLGVSPSGEVFNVNSETLAANVAGAMGASKVVYFTEQELDLRHRIHGNKIQNLRTSDARNILEYYGVALHRKGFVTFSDDPAKMELRKELLKSHMEMLLKIGWCTAAVSQGVKRAHIISPKHGALLQELYTRDGSGTLISADLYEGIRRANVLDVSAIHSIISPLIEAGTLIDRPKTVLEKDIDTYYVYTRDNHIVACGQLKKFEDGYAEIGCLVVNKDYRSRGRGDAMLGYLERLCLLNCCNKIFVLSTQTMEWFVERGFRMVPVDQLPPSRQATYNHKRASKIYMKTIESSRDLDASELWWNR
jgi:amino-acid N-acetyltransferase